MGVATRWPVLALVAGALAASGCGSDTPALAAESIPSSSAVALRIARVRVPAIDVPRVRTRGSYPQVSGGSQDLAAVNSRLLDIVRAEQSRYAAHVRVDTGPPGTGDGTFTMSPRARLTSASSVVVSSLMELTEIVPGGNGDGLVWLAVTMRVPSGERVAVKDLFADPKEGLATLAKASRSRLVAANDCVKRSQEDPLVGDLNRKGFAPTMGHYRNFALTGGGLAVGFAIGDVAGIRCGRVHVTVPYSQLRALLSPLGKRLVDGVRAPR
jgi:hypothetical protein